MTLEEIRERALAIKNPITEYEKVYELLDELGVSYKKTNCHKCRRDLYNILREEVGLIESAAEESDFNSDSDSDSENELLDGAELIFIHPRPVKFGNKTIKATSSQKDMMELYHVHPHFFLVQTLIPIDETKPQNKSC